MRRGGGLSGIIDPGAVDCGPPMLDLAWALAVDLPHGASPDPLLDAYGAPDLDALNLLLPLMMLRRLIDCAPPGDLTPDGQWITRWLHPRRPDLLTLALAALR
ncbi:phosphotransferase [Actinocorallia lasiicapitis]